MSNVLIVTGVPLNQKLQTRFRASRSWGIRFTLLTSERFAPMPGFFAGYFPCNLSETKKIIEMLKNQPVRFDAVTLQFSDWLTPLVALIAKEYGCIGNSPLTAFNCRSKYHMRKRLEEEDVPSPKFRLCRNFQELRSGVRGIGFPCVAKPVGGNGSYGVFAIMNEDDLSRLKPNYEASVKFLEQRFASGDIFSFSIEELRMIRGHGIYQYGH